MHFPPLMFVVCGREPRDGGGLHEAILPGVGGAGDPGARREEQGLRCLLPLQQTGGSWEGRAGVGRQTGWRRYKEI